MKLSVVGLLVACLLSSGCASIHYLKTRQGKLEGKLTVQWIDFDEFEFVPDPEKPLTFTRHNGNKITPGWMHTDGGSVPRPLWAFKSYSPWGYAPAFIVHDWLFEMQHCQHAGHEEVDLYEAAQIMSEVMKTLMLEENNAPNDKFALYSMFTAVQSVPAQTQWRNGQCQSQASAGPKTAEKSISKPDISKPDIVPSTDATNDPPLVPNGTTGYDDAPLMMEEVSTTVRQRPSSVKPIKSYVIEF